MEATGEVYSWGRGDYGQLGHGNKLHLELPKKIATIKPGKNPVSHVSCGRSHAAAITEEGTVFVWGQNDNGQLGL